MVKFIYFFEQILIESRDIMKNADEILKAKSPSDLFTANLDVIKEEYRAYCKQWHPDVNGNSVESHKVLTHINALYEEGMVMLDSNSWVSRGEVRLVSKDGKIHLVKFKNHHEFELGKMYIGNTVIVYEIQEQFKSLFDNAKEIISKLSFSSDRMKQEMEKYLPKLIETFESDEGSLIIVIRKTADLFLLKDVLEYYEGSIPSRHVAWILSSLYNTACYIDYSKLSHNGISTENYLISPKYHSGMLTGGWWYSVHQGTKMLKVSEKTFSIMPPLVRDKKMGSIETDLESIRLIGRELLGDRTGTKLKIKDLAPDAMIEWLRGVSSGKARTEYERWQKVLDASFGKRTFVEMPIEVNTFYNKVGKI